MHAEPGGDEGNFRSETAREVARFRALRVCHFKRTTAIFAALSSTLRLGSCGEKANTVLINQLYRGASKTKFLSVNIYCVYECGVHQMSGADCAQTFSNAGFSASRRYPQDGVSTGDARTLPKCSCGNHTITTGRAAGNCQGTLLSFLRNEHRME